MCRFFDYCAVVSGIIQFKRGISYRIKNAEATIGSAEKEAERILEEAVKMLKMRRKKL